MDFFLPISGMVLRHLWLLRNYMNRLLFAFYWPLLDILIWGSLGTWLQQLQGINNAPMIFILAILTWTVCARIANEIFCCLLEELQSHNIINIFASPLSITQWLIGVFIFISLICLTLLAFLMIPVRLLYDVSLLDLLKNLSIFAPTMFLSALNIGLLILSVLIYYGMSAVELGFVINWSFMPFSGVFYPIESLPVWAQKISAWVPMSYVFTGMRKYLLENENPALYIVKSIALNLIYGVLFLLLFLHLFNKSKDKGLARLTD